MARADDNRQDYGNSCGHYVFFERPGFATSPSGPLSSLKAAKLVARAVLTDPGVASVRIECKSAAGSREVITYRRGE
jgi:hypothetical protein